MFSLVKKIIYFILLSAIFSSICLQTDIYASSNREEFLQAEVVQIIEDREIEVGGHKTPYQKVKVRFLKEGYVPLETFIGHGKQFGIDKSQKVEVGQKVVVLKHSTMGRGIEYQNRSLSL